MATMSGECMTLPVPLMIRTVSYRTEPNPVNDANWLRIGRLFVTLNCEATQAASHADSRCTHVIGIPALPPGEFAVAADMCEEYGLAEVAKMLRACEGVQEKVEVTTRADTHRQYLQEDGTIRTGEEM